jgi:hypothetical protein
MGRTRNPAISPLLLIGLGVGAYFVLRGGGGGGGGGGGDLVGAFEARTFAGAGELFADGTKLGAIGTVPATFTLPAGVQIVLKVKFADGSESPEHRISLMPSGPASAGGTNAPQMFVSGSSSVAELARQNAIANLTALGRVDQASAVQMAADADNLMRNRMYEEALAVYAAIRETYPGTPQAILANGVIVFVTMQLQTTAGRAALDRANALR